MKKIIFLTASSMFFLISCSLNKRLKDASHIPPTEAENYFNNDTLALSETAAKLMIETFPKHKHKFTRKTQSFREKEGYGASASFDKEFLQGILNDSNIDSVRFFLAILINDGKDSFKIPTIVMQVKLKETSAKKGKGSMFDYAKYQYLKAGTLCPPPPGNCRIMPQ